VGKVSAVRKVEAHDAAMRFNDASVDRKVGRGSVSSC